MISLAVVGLTEHDNDDKGTERVDPGPGSSVGLVLLPPDSEIPMAVRLGTTSAETAHARLRQAGAKLHNDEVVHLDGAVSAGFVRPAHRDMVIIDTDPAGLLDQLAAWTPVQVSKWLDRSDR